MNVVLNREIKNNHEEAEVTLPESAGETRPYFQLPIVTAAARLT